MNDMETRLAQLEERCADQEAALVRLIAQNAAVTIAFGLVRNELAESGVLNLTRARAAVEAILETMQASDGPELSDAIRRQLVPLLADPPPPAGGTAH